MGLLARKPVLLCCAQRRLISLGFHAVRSASAVCTSHLLLIRGLAVCFMGSFGSIVDPIGFAVGFVQAWVLQSGSKLLVCFMASFGLERLCGLFCGRLWFQSMDLKDCCLFWSKLGRQKAQSQLFVLWQALDPVCVDLKDFAVYFVLCCQFHFLLFFYGTLCIQIVKCEALTPGSTQWICKALLFILWKALDSLSGSKASHKTNKASDQCGSKAQHKMKSKESAEEQTKKNRSSCKCGSKASQNTHCEVSDQKLSPKQTANNLMKCRPKGSLYQTAKSLITCWIQMQTCSFADMMW